MFDWVGSLSPEELSAYAVTIAAAIAVVSLIVQARAERQQARLALLEKRLEVFKTYNELIHRCIELGTDMVHNNVREAIPSTHKDCHDRVVQMLSMAAMLFGDEIHELGLDAMGLSHRLQRAWQKWLMVGPPGADEWVDYQDAGIDLQYRMREMFAPYIARERLVGLERKERVYRALENMSDPDSRDRAWGPRR